MAYAILRVEKLKSAGSIGGSLSHTFRTRETPNASRDCHGKNEFSHDSPAALNSALAERLPAKRRKDAVLCLEYFVGASPEWFQGRQDGEKYFQDARAWLEARHGKENVVGWAVHRDEISPHMVAYVVPLDGERLNAKKWTGGRQALNQMQTDFARQVGEKLGLERGVEGSRAKHQDIKKFYSAVHAATPKLPAIRTPMPAPLPEISLVQKILPEDRAERRRKEEEYKRQKEQRQDEEQSQKRAMARLLEVTSAKAAICDLALAQKEQAILTAKEKIKLAAEADRLRIELAKAKAHLQETKEALKKSHGTYLERHLELDRTKKELAVEREKNSPTKLTKGDCATILGDEWARMNLGPVLDRLSVAREPAPPEWAEAVRGKIQEALEIEQAKNRPARPTTDRPKF